MKLLTFIHHRNWSAIAGYLLFVGMMATGYYYNVTFVQLGLVDLGSRVIGMSRPQVAMQMALLALLTCVIALGAGFLMQQMGWGRRFQIKLRLSLGVIILQTILTFAAPMLRSPGILLVWIIAASAALGVGVPVMFSMTVDLIPVRDRGYAAAFVTGIAYLAANVLNTSWTIDAFTRQMIPVMIGGVLVLGFLVFARLPLVEHLSQQHREPSFASGRFVRMTEDGKATVRRRFLLFIIMMFGVYFVDSLGFLRLIETPIYMDAAWRSPDISVRAFIAGVHVITAIVAGILYSNLSERSLFLWVFGIFALVHFMYMFHSRVTPEMDTGLATPMLYATAVSLYTVINFAIWADISTPDSISVNTAVGVALSGWTATFISTALAIKWEGAGMPLSVHLRTVDALAILFFLAALLIAFFPERRPAGPDLKPLSEDHS